MTEPHHIDFAQIIAELVAAGVSIYKISLMCHRRYTTVNNWAKGGEPRHYEGEMLRMIHAEYVVNPLTTSPPKATATR